MRNQEQDEEYLEDLKGAIQKLRNKRAANIDNISAKQIRNGGEELHKRLHKLISMIWEKNRSRRMEDRTHHNNTQKGRIIRLLSRNNFIQHRV